MKPDEIISVLEHVLILREVPPQVLQELAESLPVERYTTGDLLYQQGTSPDALFILLDGQLELTILDTEDQQVCVARRQPGDLIGEFEMVFRGPRHHSAIATEELIVLRWERNALTKFMKSYSQALADLQFLVDGQRLSQKLRFNWLREGETIYILSRKSNFILYQKLTLPVILLLGSGFFTLWSFLVSQNWPIWVALLLGFAGLLTGIWQWIDWTNDYYLVTDWRTVWLEKVVALYDSRREAPLHTILSVAVNTDMTGRMFGFGDVMIRTYTGKLLFRNVPRPNTVAAMIEENWRRLQLRQEQADREALVGALQDRLDTTEELAASPSEPHQVLASETERLEGETRQPRQWGFRVRFEEGDTITYRKHWAVLLREIGLPSILILFLIGMLGARLGGLISLFTLPTFLLATISLLIGGSLWWLYRYVDWANDIYQITPQQIIDVYKKPLAREERKVAPIENILGTEVDRKGLIGILLNYGDVIANVGTTQFTFEGVLDPVTVQQDIVHAQEAYLQGKIESDRARRQSEMVELFDIYHERYAPGDQPRQEPDQDDRTGNRNPS
jgi:hypothetical protein